MTPEWVTAISACFAVLVAFIGILIANKQLGGIRQAIRTDSLMAILSIESELSAKKEKCDELAIKLSRTVSLDQSPESEIKLLKTRLDLALENWINTLERLCFCILKNYVPEKDWRLEYREYIAEAIRSQSEFFAAGTRYNNLLQLHEKWSRE